MGEAENERVMSADMRAALGGWRRASEAALLAVLGLSLAACAGGPPAPVAGGGAGRAPGQPSSRYSGYKVGQPYEVKGVWYTPREQPNYDEIGMASWYGEAFHNHYTADGEVFDMTLPSAAHTTLPLPSLVEVTNLANGKTLIVRVNDRGPFVDGRIIDLSKEAAAELGFVTAGVTRVRVRYVGRAPDAAGMSARTQIASAAPAPKAPPPASVAAPPPSRLVALAEAGAPAAATEDYDYATAPKRSIPYGQLAHAVAAPVAAAASVPVSVATYSAKAALRAPGVVAAASASPPPPAPTTGGVDLPEVDALLGSRPPAAAAPAPSATYDLQAGSFATEDAARRFASGLTGGGLPEVQAVHDGAQLSYQVVVHGLAGPGEAAAARTEALALGAPRALIVGGS
jgi:rare lipoprotein A